MCPHLYPYSLGANQSASVDCSQWHHIYCFEEMYQNEMFKNVIKELKRLTI